MAAQTNAMSEGIKGLLEFLFTHAGDRIKLNQLIREFGLSSEKILRVEQLKPGDHICYPFVPGDLAYHHAIVASVLSDGTVEVIEHAGPSDNKKSAMNKSSIIIRKDVDRNLNRYAADGKLYRINYENCDPADQVIARAEGEIDKAGLGGRSYHVLINNCEHFATWCKTGQAFSGQCCYVQTPRLGMIPCVTSDSLFQ